MEKERLSKVLKYVMTMRKYQSQDKCARQIAKALYRCKRTDQCIKDAYLLLGVLSGEKNGS